MATILIDTCIITDLASPESKWFEWSASTLEKLDDNNTFIINPIIYTECSVGFATIEEVEALFKTLGFANKLPRPKGFRLRSNSLREEGYLEKIRLSRVINLFI